ncbi:MAG: thiol peroxidase [Candidatus Omnitrophota bacterium]|nr:thiol peroxidase [Candidatus Omnitrophota bacterium]
MLSKITFKANPLTLVGRQIDTGSIAPDFRVVDKDLNEAGLVDFKGKIKLISSFPSIDTPVCDLQVKEFNKKAASLSADIVVIGISKDLPFAQSRFCSLNEIKNEVIFSDYKYSSFGINYGLLIKELNLLARSVLIIDKNDILRYFKIVPELTQAVDYQEALGNLEAVLKSPNLIDKQGKVIRCIPCEGVVPALARAEIEKALSGLPGWEVIEDKKITKEFKFKDFIEAKYFLDLVALIAEEQGHHPTLTLIYNKLKITLTTHAAGGLTANDFIMAGIIDRLSA